MDFFGPFYGKNYLIIVDSYSKWCEVIILSNTSSSHTIEACRSLFSKYGLPNQIVTDNGKQFTGNEFKTFCTRNGIKHVLTAPYHQSSNGQVERFVQTIKRGLKINDVEKGDAQKKLDNYLFAYRITPSCTTNKSPAELFLGRNIKSRLDLVKPSLEASRDNFLKTNDRHFKIGDKVLLRNYASSKKWLRGIIARKVGSLLYAIKVGEKIYRRHIDQLLRDTADKELDFTDDDYLDFDFEEVLERPMGTRNRPRKEYPVRERQPVNRYGFT